MRNGLHNFPECIALFVVTRSWRKVAEREDIHSFLVTAAGSLKLKVDGHLRELIDAARFVVFWGLRPMTMEGQKFEIPEDPSQTFPERSPMGPILSRYFFLTFQNSGKKRILAAILANIGMRNSHSDLGLDAA